MVVVVEVVVESATVVVVVEVVVESATVVVVVEVVVESATVVVVVEVVVESATVVVVVEVVVESATVVVVVEDDIKVSLFETSLPPQNEMNNIKNNLDMRFIIKLSQRVCLCVSFYYLYVKISEKRSWALKHLNL